MNEVRLKLICECCGELGVTEVIKQISFEYGSGETPEVLNAEVPVLVCDICDMEYTDSRAEDIRHDAICKHLNLLTSMELRSMRMQLRWTIAKLAEETGIGSASLGRWENCQLFQSRANDNFLRLFYEKKKVSLPSIALQTVPIRPKQERFPTLQFNSLLEARASSFSLCTQ